MYPDRSPEALFGYWVRPELLREWWPPVAVIEPRVGEDEPRFTVW
jgi:uncharacterized protein YndB with AHSA1/START domain